MVGCVFLNFIGDLNKRYLRISYLFTFIRDPLSWRSTLEFTAELFTINAEYMAMTEAFNFGLLLAFLIT